MPVIGATQLEPVNILGSYVQGLEASRQARAQRMQEEALLGQAQRETALRNFLSSADLSKPDVRNELLRFGKPGAELAASIEDIAGKRATAEKTGLDIKAAEMKMADDNYGRFQKMLGDFAYGKTAPTKDRVIDELDFLIAQGVVAPEFKQFAVSTLPDDPAQLQTTLRSQFLSQIPPAERAKLFVPKSQEVFAQDVAEKTAGASRTTIMLPGRKRGEKLEELGAVNLENEYKAAQSAARGLARDYDTLRLLREGKPATGVTSEIETNFARWRGKFGGDPESIQVATDSQLLEALLGSQVFEQIQSLGIGARGLDTPAEREFLREVISGTRKLDKDTLIEMAEMRAKYKEDLLNDYNSRIESGELDDFFTNYGVKKKKFELPERPTAPSEPKVFATEAEAEKAFSEKKLQRGDRVTIGGRTGTWE